MIQEENFENEHRLQLTLVNGINGLLSCFKDEVRFPLSSMIGSDEDYFFRQAELLPLRFLQQHGAAYWKALQAFYQNILGFDKLNLEPLLKVQHLDVTLIMPKISAEEIRQKIADKYGIEVQFPDLGRETEETVHRPTETYLFSTNFCYLPDEKTRGENLSGLIGGNEIMSLKEYLLTQAFYKFITGVFMDMETRTTTGTRYLNNTNLHLNYRFNSMGKCLICTDCDISETVQNSTGIRKVIIKK